MLKYATTSFLPVGRFLLGNDLLIRRITDNCIEFLHDSVLSQKLFSIESDFVEKNSQLVREYNQGDSYDSDVLSPQSDTGHKVVH